MDRKKAERDEQEFWYQHDLKEADDLERSQDWCGQFERKQERRAQSDKDAEVARRLQWDENQLTLASQQALGVAGSLQGTQAAPSAPAPRHTPETQKRAHGGVTPSPTKTPADEASKDGSESRGGPAAKRRAPCGPCEHLAQSQVRLIVRLSD